MKVINKNLLTTYDGLIGIQCNCKGVINYGIGKEFSNRYTSFRAGYIRWCNTDAVYLGVTHVFGLPLFASDLAIGYMYAQEGYGSDKVHTDYKALGKCLRYLEEWNKWKRVGPIYLPYGLGCGENEGGDWSIVQGLIEEHCPSAIVCK